MADILHRVGFRAPIEKLYQALTDRDHLAGWWTRRTQGESTVGGVLTFRFTTDGEEIGGFDMKVRELQLNRRVLWEVVDGPAEWIGTMISFDLTMDGDWAILLFKHTGWKEPVEFMHHCSTKWATFLLSLRDLVETGVGRPDPNDLKVSNWH